MNRSDYRIVVRNTPSSQVVRKIVEAHAQGVMAGRDQIKPVDKEEANQ